MVDAVGELPRSPASDPELVNEGLWRHGRDIAHRVQAEAVHPPTHLGIEREQVNPMRREKGGRVGRDVRHTRRIAGPGCDKGGELGVSDSDAGPQVARCSSQGRCLQA